MWEAIRSNQRRSRLLIVLMGMLLIGLGAGIGLSIDPQFGAQVGALIAMVIWLIMWLIAITRGDAIVLGSMGAREIEKQDAPQLWNVVEEMTIASGLKKMPRVFLIENDAPNAFAVGRKQETAAVAVTTGMLERLSRDELQGVEFAKAFAKWLGRPGCCCLQVSKNARLVAGADLDRP